MDLKQFKKLGLKSGDRVCVRREGDREQGDREQGYCGMYISYTADRFIWLPEGEIQPRHSLIEQLEEVEKLKVTKKKEKEEGEQLDVKKAASFIIKRMNEEQKPIKSLSTLEVGDEVEKDNEIYRKILNVGGSEVLRLYAVSEAYYPNEDTNNDKRFCCHWSSYDLHNGGYKLVQRQSCPDEPAESIIDEMIEYFEMYSNIPLANRIRYQLNNGNFVDFNKFINYLKELKT